MSQNIPDDNTIAAMLKEADQRHSPPAGTKRAVKAVLMAKLASPKRVWFRLTKIAAAVICLAVLGLWWLSSSPDMASSAYAEMLEAVGNTQAAEWVHIDVEGSEVREGWISFRPYRQCYATAKQVIYEDGLSGRLYSYEQSSQTITVKLLDRNAGMREKSGLLDFISTAIDTWAKKRGAEVLKNLETIEGKDYTIYSVKVTGQPKEGLLEVKIDSEINRVVRVKFAGGSLPEPIIMRFDYPETGPADIYELGVPRDAKIVDLTKPQESGETESE